MNRASSSLPGFFLRYLFLLFIVFINSVYADDYISGKTLFTANKKSLLTSPTISDTLYDKKQDRKKISDLSSLKEAAQQDFSPAQHALAIYYLSNDKIQLDKAVYWLKKSAAHKNNDALRDLAYLYYQGLGVKKDLLKAKHLLTEPVKNKNAFAISLLADIEKELLSQDDKHILKTKNWYNESNNKYIDYNSLIKGRVFSWMQAWQEKNINQYLDFYSKRFNNSHGDYKSWEKYRRRVFKFASNIRIKITDLRIEKKSSIIITSFKQYYYSDNYSDKVHKELRWQKDVDFSWRIISETASTLAPEQE